MANTFTPEFKRFAKMGANNPIKLLAASEDQVKVFFQKIVDKITSKNNPNDFTVLKNHLFKFSDDLIKANPENAKLEFVARIQQSKDAIDKEQRELLLQVLRDQKFIEYIRQYWHEQFSEDDLSTKLEKISTNSQKKTKEEFSQAVNQAVYSPEGRIVIHFMRLLETAMDMTLSLAGFKNTVFSDENQPENKERPKFLPMPK